MGHVNLGLGLIWYANFLLAITCHEAAHAWAADRGGDETAQSEGLVTVDPRPHMRREPFGTILVPIISYFLNGWMIGWGSAPYNPYWADRFPRRAAWMALAGPAANLALALIAIILMYLGISLGILTPSTTWRFEGIIAPASPAFGGIASMLSIMFCLNVLLCAFNMLPLPPLDGIKVLGLFTNEVTAARLREVGNDPTYSLIGILVAWHVFDYVWQPVFRIAARLIP